MEASRQDVIECYRRILGRDPENDEIVDRRLAMRQDIWSLVRDFVHSDEYRAIAGRFSAHSMLKCFSDTYLARGLSRRARSAALMRNYAALNDSLDPDHLMALLDGGLAMLTEPPEFPEASIDMLLFDGPVDEGEISLVLTVAGRRTAVLTFTIVPSAEFDLPSGDAFFISRLQGYFGARDDFQEAARRFEDISPPYLLMCVLEGVARAQGVSRLIGVNALAQSFFKPSYAALFERAYDQFFTSLGASRLPSGLYAIELPRVPRPLDEITPGHRARTKAKRAAKTILTDASRERWQGYMRPDPAGAAAANRNLWLHDRCPA